MRPLAFLCALGILAIAVSCGPAEAPEGQSVVPAYFDVKSWMKAEAQRLEQIEPRVLKKVTMNGVSEAKELNSLDYHAELTAFLEADLNRPAWRGRFEVDTVINGARGLTVTYQASANDIPIKRLSVVMYDGQVSRLAVERRSQSVFTNAMQQLSYQPDSGYSIRTRQQVWLGKDEDILIEVSFIR